MAKQKGELSKSEEIRLLLKTNPKTPVKEIVAALDERGISVTPNLVYFIKGRMRGRRRKAKSASEGAAVAVVATNNGDAVKTILKVKGWALEVGGMKKLKGLVDALSE
jgi:hypothetical protein